MADFCVERVLLTNDDGIDAPGMAALEDVAAEIAREVWVVAPAYDQSGSSHSISLHAPLRVSQQGERRFAVSGTPGDSVVLGVQHLMAAARPDLVLSGINRGANLGVETVFSGTVGAAMTALLLGLPAIALSQHFARQQLIHWETARAWGPSVIRQLVASGWEGQQACLNVNFPHAPPDAAGPLTPTRQGVGLVEAIEVVERTDPRDLAYHWLQFRRGPRTNAPDSEAVAIASARISVTPLRFERTDEATYATLSQNLAAPED